jgi:hypothetical protein
MFGNWVNEDPESVHARAKELMNDPAWTQVGMNPFRYSWFYDKSDGMPLDSADEVIQVGALVLAKNAKKISPTDPMFETKSAKGGKIKFQKQSKEDAVQDAKDKYELSVEKRGKDHKTGVTAAIADLQKSDWYRDSDDTQREEVIREIKKFFGEKLKAAPSVAKVMGKTKQTAFVSDLAAAIRDKIKLQARSSRETAKDINDRRKALGESIKEVVKSYKGKITEKQLNAINRRIASVNLFNQEMVERVVDYVNKVMGNAEYAGKVNNAFAERRAIRRMMKSGNMTETVAVAREFVQIDPSMVDDIDTYLEMAAQIRGAVKSSKRVKDSVSLKQIVNFGEAYEYIKPTLERQEEMMKNMRLAEYNDLVDSGVISKDMTLKEINKIINNIRNNEDAEIKANEEAAAMEFLKDKLGFIKTLLRISPLKGYNPVTGEQIQISERHSNMINNIIKSDLNDLSLKQMIDMIVSLNNFYENGAVGGLEAAGWFDSGGLRWWRCGWPAHGFLQPAGPMGAGILAGRFGVRPAGFGLGPVLRSLGRGCRNACPVVLAGSALVGRSLARFDWRAGFGPDFRWVPARGPGGVAVRRQCLARCWCAIWFAGHPARCSGCWRGWFAPPGRWPVWCSGFAACRVRRPGHCAPSGAGGRACWPECLALAALC